MRYISLIPEVSRFPDFHSLFNAVPVVELALSRVPDDLRPSVMDIMNQSKSSSSQKRAALLKKGLLRSTADELEIFAEIDEDIDGLLMKLEKISPSLLTIMKPAVDEIKQSIQYATSAGFNGPIYLRPLMWATHHAHFNDGLRLEVVRCTRRQDVLAAAGRSVLLSFCPLPDELQTCTDTTN